MKVFICLSALLAMAHGGPLNAFLTSGAAAGPLHPAVGALAATKRGWRNIALEGFSEDDNQDGFVDPIGAVQPVVYAAPVAYAAHIPYVHHAVAPVVAAPKVVTYAAPQVYAAHPLTYTHTVPAHTYPLAHAPFYGGLYGGPGFFPGLAVAAPAKAEEVAITEA